MDNTEMDKTEEVKSKKKEKSEKKEKIEKKEKSEKKNFPDLRLNFTKYIESIQSNWKALLFTAIVAVLFMGAITLAVFFAMVKSPEEVLVPNVVNKPLEEALQEMQVKELYPTKTVWVYTGFLWEDVKDEADLKYFDVLAEGRFVEELLDNNLHWVGSSNQRVIDVQESLKQNKVILSPYNEKKNNKFEKLHKIC